MCNCIFYSRNEALRLRNFYFQILSFDLHSGPTPRGRFAPAEIDKIRKDTNKASWLNSLILVEALKITNCNFDGKNRNLKALWSDNFSTSGHVLLPTTNAPIV